MVACLAGALALAGPPAAQASFHPRLAGGLGLEPMVNARGEMQLTDVATEGQVPLTYHGGQVMAGGVTVHTIFWAPPGYAFQGSPGSGIPTYEGMVQQFFADLAHDSGASGTCTSAECTAMSVLPQYAQGTSPGGVSPGSYAVSYSAASDSVDDSDPYPAASSQCASPAGAGTCVTDGQVQAEIDHVIGATPGTSRGLGNLWFVFLPPGVDECIDRGDCGTSAFAGYHSVSNLAGHGVTIYALVVDPIIEVPVAPGSDPEGYPDAEAALDVAGHETAEAITDPEGAGWMDPNGFEVGDKCDVGPQLGTPLGFAADGSPYNQVIDGHPYQLQELWANAGASGGGPGCVQATTTTANPLPLPQVNLRQFDSQVTGNVNRSPGGGIGVRVSLLRAGAAGGPVIVARATTTTAPDGSWSVSLAPHAPGDDRDEIDIDYSGAGAPQPNHQVILTGNGGNPFTEAGWTGWLALDAGSALTTSALTLAPCFQAGLLSFTRDGAPGPVSPTDFCNTQTDSATVALTPVAAADKLTVTSNDNRAFASPDAPTPNPAGGLVSLTVPVGEPAAAADFTSPMNPPFQPGGLPGCTADLELQGVLCTGLVPGARYTLSDRGRPVAGRADTTGTLVESLAVRGGDAVTLANAARSLTTLHVARLRVLILGDSPSVAAGACQPGEYYGAPLAAASTSDAAGVPTTPTNGGVALTGQICPLNGDAAGLSAADIEQTDELSGGQTETEVPDVEDTSPIEGETMYGHFTALAESGLAAPGNAIIPTDGLTQISLRIATARRDQTAFTATNVDTLTGVPVPALRPGAYTALWTLRDLNGDVRLVETRFIEQAGRIGAGPRARVSCRSAGATITCRVTFQQSRRLTGRLRVRLTRDSVVVGLGHGRVRRGRATIRLRRLRLPSRGRWEATLVLSRPHLEPVTSRARVSGLG